MPLGVMSNGKTILLAVKFLFVFNLNVEIGFYSPFPGSLSDFPLHFTSQHQRLLHNK